MLCAIFSKIGDCLNFSEAALKLTAFLKENARKRTPASPIGCQIVINDRYAINFKYERLIKNQYIITTQYKYDNR